MWRPDQYNSFCSHPGTYLFYTGEKYLSPLIQEERIGARWADTWLVLCQCPSFGLLAWQDERQFYVQGFSRRKEKTPPACDVWLATIYKDFLLKNIQEGSFRATTSQITKDIAYCLVKLPPADPSTSHFVLPWHLHLRAHELHIPGRVLERVRQCMQEQIIFCLISLVPALSQWIFHCSHMLHTERWTPAKCTTQDMLLSCCSNTETGNWN